jgi:hypothetical protein
MARQWVRSNDVFRGKIFTIFSFQNCDLKLHKGFFNDNKLY